MYALYEDLAHLLSTNCYHATKIQWKHRLRIRQARINIENQKRLQEYKNELLNRTATDINENFNSNATFEVTTLHDADNNDEIISLLSTDESEDYKSVNEDEMEIINIESDTDEEDYVDVQ